MTGEHHDILQELFRTVGLIQGEQTAARRRMEEMTRWISKVEERQKNIQLELQSLKVQVALYAGGSGAVGMAAVHFASNYFTG